MRYLLIAVLFCFLCGGCNQGFADSKEKAILSSNAIIETVEMDGAKYIVVYGRNGVAICPAVNQGTVGRE